MAGFYLRILRVIYSSVGHRGKGGAVHPVDIYVVAGGNGSRSAARYGAGHVKGGHGLFGICGHIKFFSVNGIFIFTGITAFVVFPCIVPFGRRRGNTGRRYPAHLVDSTGKASCDTCVAADTHGCRAAEFRHVGVIRRMDGHIAAFVCCVKL